MRVLYPVMRRYNGRAMANRTAIGFHDSARGAKMRRQKGARHAHASIRASGRECCEEANRTNALRALLNHTREEYAETLPLQCDSNNADVSGLDHEAPRHKVLDIG